MIFDRQRQRLLLQGMEYTAGDISRLVAEGAENCSPALWDLYIFFWRSGSMPLRLSPSIRRAAQVRRKSWWCAKTG